MKDTLIGLAVILVVIGAISWPVLWLVATVDACGWKGLFVECRVMEAR